MATPAQITANRVNAQRSTGPRTEEGKARSAANSFKHGFFSKAFIVSEEEQADFDDFVQGLENSLRPADVISQDLFAQILHASWNLHRLRKLENELYAASDNPFADEKVTRKLDLLARHRARFERSRRSAMKEYQAHITRVFTRFGLPHEGQDEVPLAVDVHRIHKTRREMFKAFPRYAYLSPEERQREEEEQEREEQERLRKMDTDSRMRYPDGTPVPEQAGLLHPGI